MRVFASVTSSVSIAASWVAVADATADLGDATQATLLLKKQ